MKSQGMLISALVFAFVVALFAVINVEPVQVNFLFAKPEVPLILVILSSTLLGGIIVGMFGMLRQYKLQKTIKVLEKQLQGVAPAAGSFNEVKPAQQPGSDHEHGSSIDDIGSK